MTYLLKPYDEALQEILEYGVKKENRTGVDTLAIFGMQKRYRIDKHFPLLTKRKVWPKAIFAELIWMLSGSTNNNDLKALGADFWTPWVDEEFEKKHGFAPGCLGPVYGFQLRHFGGYYGNGNRNKPSIWETIRAYIAHETPRQYGNYGFDQVQYMMDLLKENPNSRRILWSMWNPSDLDKMKLPPCHYSFQLFVHDDKLSGHLTQRSCDFPVGVPANIQFYSALIYMFAQQTGYKPHEFVHTTVDAHIYVRQIEAVERYLGRPTPDSPTLELNEADDIFSYKVDDFQIKDYKPEKPIKISVEV